jgi:hypothetical protein
MRLNAWQRVGIVVSIVWAVAAAICQRNADVERAQDFVKYAFKVCTDAQSLSRDKDPAGCSQESETHRAIWLAGSWSNVALVSLVPIAFGWLAVYTIVGIRRRIAPIDFGALLPWATMPLRRKKFAVAGALVGFVVVLSGVLTVFNLYVDAKIPVVLGYGAFVTEVGNNVVSATGTWTLQNPAKMDSPLQTSRINCYRERRRCTEAKAYVTSGKFLAVDLVEYEIELWTDSMLVFKNKDYCVSTVITIDRKIKTVSGVGRFTNMDTRVCEGATDKGWTVYLTDGYKVYWEQRRKVGSIPLRLIRMLPGN